ncbi:hypothetical protein [Actinomadura opuntiae]|nr:hypothetical protein [Actinomadura sp. OS1-43]MDL4818645.1 hypothetical protein [Actinomadura sp. OS1-43]
MLLGAGGTPIAATMALTVVLGDGDKVDGAGAVGTQNRKYIRNKKDKP